MARLVDLHLHSNYSDGLYAPAEVIGMAADVGLVAAALADHDNVDGVDEALAAGRERGIEVLPAVELSVIWENYQDIHLLGYGMDHHHPELVEALREFREFRASRNERIVAKVNELLAQQGREAIAFADVAARAGGSPGRPHIAMELIARGHARDQDEAFRRYLVPCNVPKRFFPIQEAIELIHRAGGVTSLAHPPYITPDRHELQRLFDVFTDMGVDGIEAYNNRSSNAEIDWFITQARRRDLIVTGGSDFHGIHGAEIVIGGGRGNLRIPYSCVEEIREALVQRLAVNAAGERQS
jgi:hypothetical protein